MTGLSRAQAMVDWDFVYLLLIVGLATLSIEFIFVFQQHRESNGSGPAGLGQALKQVFAAWAIYMGLFALLSTLVRAMIHLLCTYCST
ncbi:MAG: hypothetical protein AB1411_16765 [Nitrospirota bacterium]